MNLINISQIVRYKKNLSRRAASCKTMFSSVTKLHEIALKIGEKNGDANFLQICKLRNDVELLWRTRGQRARHRSRGIWCATGRKRSIRYKRRKQYYFSKHPLYQQIQKKKKEKKKQRACPRQVRLFRTGYTPDLDNRLILMTYLATHLPQAVKNED